MATAYLTGKFKALTGGGSAAVAVAGAPQQRHGYLGEPDRQVDVAVTCLVFANAARARDVLAWVGGPGHDWRPHSTPSSPVADTAGHT